MTARRVALAVSAALLGSVAAAPAASAGVPFSASADWVELGPDPIAVGPEGVYSQWATTAGRATAVVIDPGDPDTVFIGASQGGVWRTRDGGAHWTPLLDGADASGVQALLLASDGTLWVGTGSDSATGVGLYRILRPAADDGGTLEGPFDTRVLGDASRTSAFAGNTISAIALDPHNPDRMYVGTKYYIRPARTAAEPGLYYTENATSADPQFTRVEGLPSMVKEEIQGINEAQLIPGSSCELVLTLNTPEDKQGIYRIDDAEPDTAGCQTRVSRVYAWSRQDAYFASHVAVSKDVVYVSSSEGPGWAEGSLFKSTDRGETFTRLTSVKGWGVGYHQGGIGVDPNNPDHVFLGGPYSCHRIDWCAEPRAYRTLVRSIDGGATFHTADGPYKLRGKDQHAYVHPDTTAIAFAPSDPNIAYTTNDGGVYRTANALTPDVGEHGLAGVDWKSRNVRGFGITQFYSLAVHPYDPDFTLGGTQDNGALLHDPNGGREWAIVRGGDVIAVHIDASSGRDTSRMTSYVNCSRFTGLDNLLELGSGTSVPCRSNTFGAMGPGSPNVLYSGVKSPFDGSSNRVLDSRGRVVFCCATVTAFAPSPDGEHALVGTSGGALYQIEVDCPEVKVPTRCADAVPVAGGWPTHAISAIAYDPSDPDTVTVGLDGYLNSGSHVYRTTKLSARPEWEAAGTGLPDNPVRSIIVDPAYPHHLYLGTDSGVFVGTIEAAELSWRPFGTGLPRGCSAATGDSCATKLSMFGQTSMAVAPAKRVLRIATFSRGMWEIPLANEEPIGVDDVFSVDEDERLHSGGAGVLANDTDRERGPLTAVLVDGPGDGTLALKPDGSFTYAPDRDFDGQDRFTYRVTDGALDSAETATVTIDVAPVNDPPKVSVLRGTACDDAGEAGTFDLRIADPDSDVDGILVTARSSDALVVNPSAVTFGGSGALRQVTIRVLGMVMGAAVVTITADDGADTTEIEIAVAAGGNGNDVLSGGGGSDVVFAGNGSDVLEGGDGPDVLCGGNGDDRLDGGAGDDGAGGHRGADVLTGGPGADRFSGGPGEDTVADHAESEGDSSDGT